MRVTPEQIARLMKEDPTTQICLHDVVAIHDCIMFPEPSVMYTVRFVGHTIPYPEYDPDASPDTVIPDSALFAIDILMVDRMFNHLAKVMAETGMEAIQCRKVRRNVPDIIRFLFGGYGT